MSDTTESAPVMGGATQRFVAGNLPLQWWSLFHSGALDALVRDALAANPTLAVARATLRQAQENLAARTGDLLYPGVNASLSGTRQKTIVNLSRWSRALARSADRVALLCSGDVVVATKLAREAGGGDADVDLLEFALGDLHLELRTELTPAN